MTITRLIAAPPAQLWRAWTDPVLLPQWFGPQGFTCQTKEIDLRDGGLWRFDMIGPDGTIWANRHHDLRYTPMTSISFLLDDDGDSVPMAVAVTLTPEGSGTRIVQTVTFPTAADYATARSFGAEALGQTTLAKLAALVES